MPKTKQVSGGRKRRKVHPDIDALLKRAESYGWLVDRKRTHPQICLPDGGLITVAATPSDHRTVKNTKALIERKRKEQIAGK